MIECRICNQKFSKVITWNHLRLHGLTTKEYKERFGKNSVSTPEHREQCSKRMKKKLEDKSFKEMMKASHNTELARENHRKSATTPEAIERTRAQMTVQNADPEFQAKAKAGGQTDEAKEKRRESLKEAWSKYTEEEKQERIDRASASQRTEEGRKAVSDRMQKSWKDPEFRAMMIEALEKDKENKSKRMKARWENDREAIQKAISRGLSSKKTKPHQRLKQAMLDAGITGFKSEQWMGRPLIDGKRMAFRSDEVNWDHRIVVEVNGCYWHACPKCGKAEKDKTNQQRKVAWLRSQGWIVIEVWEHEIGENLPEVVRKIGQIYTARKYCAA